ncbi:MAG: pseudouridine synthase [Candidatus Aminicenantales bacterium]
MKIRLNKFLSEAGVASRRQADRWILEGRVSVNRRIVDELGVKVDEDRDVIQVDGKTVKKESRFLCLLLNKPSGYLVTLKDPFHRPTVRDLLPASLGRVFPVGRLDFQSEGALLLTNDGELAYRLTHPRFGVRKTYIVRVRGQPDEKALRRLERGVLVEGKKTAPTQAVLLTANPKSSRLRIELSEGRKREVREMCRAVGHPVLELRRVAFAGLGLKSLKIGAWRHLEPPEVRRLRRLVDLA